MKGRDFMSTLSELKSSTVPTKYWHRLGDEESE
jgi:hypothetical protein